jgi:PHD/YefM family antitoxin component YafN of YafNO toxin-antitoxin module
VAAGGVVTLRVALDELVGVKDVARTLPRLLDRLESGDVPHLVITRRNEPRAVLLTLERYEALLEAEAGQR